MDNKVSRLQPTVRRADTMANDRSLPSNINIYIYIYIYFFFFLLISKFFVGERALSPYRHTRRDSFDDDRMGYARSPPRRLYDEPYGRPISPSRPIGYNYY
jgi:hypothetical protein